MPFIFHAYERSRIDRETKVHCRIFVMQMLIKFTFFFLLMPLLFLFFLIERFLTKVKIPHVTLGSFEVENV